MAVIASTPVNTIDPLTGLPIERTAGELTLILETDPLAGSRDHTLPGSPLRRGSPKPVRVGFSCKESLETVGMSAASTKQVYAQLALANQALNGGLAPRRLAGARSR